jgi:hypothetical protein
MAQGYSWAIPDHDFTDNFEAQENIVSDADDLVDLGVDADIDFRHIVRENFVDHYGSFVTRHISDIAALIAPSIRLMNGALCKEIVADFKQASKAGRRLVACNEDALNLSKDIDDILEDIYTDGIALSEPHMYSLLYTLAACGLIEECKGFDVSDTVKKFCGAWEKQLSGKSRDTVSASEVIACFYALRHNPMFWADAMKRIASFGYSDFMPFLCDVPTTELGFYPIFAQLAYPAHNNVAETRRYRYVAEGKKTTMLLDVLPFDECRYVYDWLASAQLVDNDWMDESRQLVFRFSLDGVAKIIRWYHDDFLYGCHVVGIDDGQWQPPMYSLREEITKSLTETDPASLAGFAKPVTPK